MNLETTVDVLMSEVHAAKRAIYADLDAAGGKLDHDAKGIQCSRAIRWLRVMLFVPTSARRVEVEG